MVSWALPLLALLAAACASSSAKPAATCPAGTVPQTESDSDVGWGGIERTTGCMGASQKWNGPVVENVSEGRRRSRLTGRYVEGIRVGPWAQTDARTGVQLASFELDAYGTGVQVLRDHAGRTRRGRVVRGRREGDWIYADETGKTVAVERWSNDSLLGPAAVLPWDPPMMDPRDACDGGDGCP